MSTSGRILADFHPIRTYFGFFNPLRLFIFENGAASTFIRPSTFIPEVRVGTERCDCASLILDVREFTTF